MQYYILICIFLQMRCTLGSNVNVPKYDGAQVWKTNLDGRYDILLLRKLINNLEISVWNLTPKTAEFLVLSENKVNVNRHLSAKNINHTVLILDVERRVDSLKVNNALWTEQSLRIGHRLSWNEYPTPSVIEEYFNYLSTNFPSICKLESIGQTAENRTITMITISNGNPENKKILLTSGMHGRDWVAITSALYVVDHIVTKFDILPEYIRNCDWVIIPVLNPDGFEYTHTHDRLWRKNRRKLGKCIGVDVNRNFGQNFFISGITETNECVDRFAGTKAFSEAESSAVLNLLTNATKMPNALVDIHMYGQKILYPWTSNALPTNDRKLHQDVGEAINKAIQNKTGNTYETGVSYQMMYPVTGSLLDWAYSVGVPLTFAIQTQNSGNYGFLLPPKDIEPVAIDVLAAVTYLAGEIGKEVSKDKKGWF